MLKDTKRSPPSLKYYEFVFQGNGHYFSHHYPQLSNYHGIL